MVASSLRPKVVLDAFAGDGTSTHIFARYAEQIIAIEKDRQCANGFLNNAHNRKVTLIINSNLRILPLLAPRAFELIDLDPCGSCYDQIELCANLLSDRGILLLSSGEIQRVVRGLSLSRFAESRNYKGRKAVLWAESVWIPYVTRLLFGQGCKVRPIHFFTSPVLIRVVFAAENAQFCLKALNKRPKYLSWFRQVLPGFSPDV